MRFSIILITKDRPSELNLTLQSLNNIRNSLTFELIIVDQSERKSGAKIIAFCKNKRKLKFDIRYFKVDFRGKSRGLNFASHLAKGEIFAFTDDDCLVSKNWLKNINDSFERDKDIAAVFGQVLPYKSFLKNKKLCPCVFLKKKKTVINKPCLHSRDIGFGNNMAFRKEVFNQVGDLKKWLGPGAVGLAAEDAEFTLRCLIKGHEILYNPKIKVSHNRWLSREEYRRQNLSYICGELACYGYFAFQGKKFAKKIVVNNFNDSYCKTKKIIKKILLKGKGFKSLWYALEEFYFRLRGLAVAFYYSKKDPLK